MKQSTTKQSQSTVEKQEAVRYNLSDIECPTLTETQKYALLKIFNDKKEDGDHIVLNSIGFANAEIMLRIVQYSYLVYMTFCDANERLENMDEHIYIAIAMNYILIPRVCFFDTKELAHYIANYFDENQKEIQRTKDIYFWASEKDASQDPLKYLLCLQHDLCFA